MGFKFSKYQKEIFKFIKYGTGNAVINAKAGSGKTTTLIKSMSYIPESENVIFLAFNKSIEQELSEKLKDFDNVRAKTYHGLGYSILKENVGRNNKLNVCEYKYSSYINSNIHKLSPIYPSLSKQHKVIYKNNIKLLVDYCRYNLAQSIDEVNILCDKYGITILSDECDIVLRVLEWGKNELDDIDYTDMIWICIEKDLETRIFKFDYIFIDEAQDSSIMQQSLIKKCYKRGTRFVAIGDESQCINAFAGADQEAFDKFKNEINTTTFDMPITYRCPKSIVEHVNKNTNVNIISAPGAIIGAINYDVSPFEPKNNDMVLCRNTAHLVKLYMMYNKINKKSYLKGRNIADEFISLVKNTKQDYLSLNMMCDGVFPRLYLYLFELINKEIELTGLEYEEIINTKKIIDIIDAIKALECLSEGLVTTEELLNKINVIFTEEKKDGVCLSTIHKAKGLEADNVFILCPSLMPSKYARKKWEIDSENNLKYVALTRSKRTLNYISEKKFPPNLFNDINIIDSLETQRKKMDRALGVETKTLKVDFKTKEDMISNDVEKIMNKNNNSLNKTNERKRNNIGGNKFSKFLK